MWQLVSLWGVKIHFGEIPLKNAYSGIFFFSIFTNINWYHFCLIRFQLEFLWQLGEGTRKMVSIHISIVFGCSTAALKQQMALNFELQGVSLRNWLFKLALRVRKTNIYFDLWCLVASGGVDICVSSTSFQKNDIGWPQ